MIPLQKPYFAIDFPKNCLCNCFAGAHTGAPLRLYLRGFNAFVGADRCVLLEKIVGTNIVEMILKNGILQCNQKMNDIIGYTIQQ